MDSLKHESSLSRARPMSSVFLYGDVGENFANLSEPFVRASGGRHAEIALLMMPQSQAYEARYRDALLASGAGQVTPIYPPRTLLLKKDQLRTLGRSTGILMAGGNTSVYRRTYGTRVVSRLIRELYVSGVPYGGVSAGAKMACDYITFGLPLVRTKTNEYRLASRGFVESYRKEHPRESPGLVIKNGLGLVKDCVLEPHFTEWGLFPRLMEGLTLSNSGFGIGVDEPTCLELQGGSKATVRGRGRLYVLTRPTRRAEDPVCGVRAYEPGSRFELRG